jgi:hypothetical protein
MRQQTQMQMQSQPLQWRPRGPVQPTASWTAADLTQLQLLLLLLMAATQMQPASRQQQPSLLLLVVALPNQPHCL